MSKLSKSGIEEALNIPSAEDLQRALSILNQADESNLVSNEEPELSVEEMKEIIKSIRNERKETKQETNISKRQKRLEAIYQMSTKYFEDIMDKAFNTEDKHASDMFNAASSMLKIATEAETSLINADTKMAELQLKKEKQDVLLNKMTPTEPKDINGQSVLVMDRNSLLKEMNKEPKK